MAGSKSVARHSSIYLLGQISMMAAGLISFPVYTRMLSVSEYGLLSLVTITITFAASICKLGLQHSIIRMYPEIHQTGVPERIESFYSTLFWSITGMACIGTLIFTLGLDFLPIAGLEQRLKECLLIVSGSILFSCCLQSFNEFFRAELKPAANVMVNIGSRYSGFMVSVLSFFILGRTVEALLMGLLFSQGAAFGLLSCGLIWAKRIQIRRFCTHTLKRAVLYGLPLMGGELCHEIVHMADRYVLLYYLDAEHVGIYAVGYTLCSYVAQVLSLPVRDAFFPVALRTWEERDKEYTADFLGRGLKYYVFLGIPIVMGLSCIGKEIIAALASQKYAAGAAVVPYVVLGLVVYGSWPFIGSGLFMAKKTMTVTLLMIGLAFVNVGLNVLLVRWYGLIGAGVASCLAYCVYIAALGCLSWREVRIRMPWREIVLYSLAGLCMYGCIKLIRGENVLIIVGGRVLIGSLVYMLLVCIFDREIRGRVVSLGAWFLDFVVHLGGCKRTVKGS